jgi:hypothetical protein
MVVAMVSKCMTEQDGPKVNHFKRRSIQKIEEIMLELLQYNGQVF